MSGAYGDLALAVSFVYGQEFSTRAAFALPERLHDANRDGLPVQAYPYRSVEDILRAARTWDAAIVFLFSAYGFPIERLCAPLGVRHFVDFLQRDERRRVVTSDPFLGSASIITKAAVRQMLPAPRDWLHDLLVVRPNARRIARELDGVASALQGIVHLYPAPADFLENATGAPRISFFNPELPHQHPEWEDPSARHAASRDEPSSKGTWLFVLAPNDVALQQKKAGADGFVSDLLRMFQQTGDAGRRPVLIGPPPLLEQLAGNLPTSLAAELVGFCSYREFSTRLREAEYAFFWNVFSCSAVFGRLVRGLPVLFLDQGHVARFSKKIYEDGLRCYFQGWEPTQVKQGALDAHVLAELASEQARSVERVTAYWRQSPTPEQVIERILQTEGV